MERRSVQLKKTLTLILAGGQGERLYPLTKNRSKPSVPFGGIYRIIDFTLSNCLNSGLRKIFVLTQYKSLTLDAHIKQGWHIFNIDLGEFIYSVPPQQITSDSWYRGTADAVYQNIYLLEHIRPERVFVLSGDHIYKMDYSEMVSAHIDSGADLTMACVEVPVDEAHRFGVVQVDAHQRVVGFQEKPPSPMTIPGQPDCCLVNMGVYLFNTHALVKSVIDDAKRDSQHDFGKNVLPDMIQSGFNVYAYNFRDINNKQASYWRDIGTIESYYAASMDLVSVDPLFNLYDGEWPIRTYSRQSPPVKTVFAQEEAGRAGVALDSLLSPGCIISGGRVERSIISPHVRVNSYSNIMDSILMDHVAIGRHCKIRSCIIDEGVIIPAETVIGYDSEHDAKRFTVSPTGIVVVPSGIQFD
ncbi:MAG: glucose-1-phosphate adenylyltransferase [Acidobacteria bacterium]|nr:glucose-1-phosphate adenylyltransferase [Acidobacteriota bacterium]MBI3654927.1 glucose-1-phosphate adenylyltransferase [Acidobacteriota bacterium]